MYGNDCLVGQNYQETNVLKVYFEMYNNNDGVLLAILSEA